MNISRSNSSPNASNKKNPPSQLTKLLRTMHASKKDAEYTTTTYLQPCALLSPQLLLRLTIGSLPHLNAQKMRSTEVIFPLLLPRGQAPTRPIISTLNQSPNAFEIFFKVRIEGGKGDSITLVRDPILLPVFLLLKRGKGQAASEKTGGEHGLPFEDFEGEAGSHGADEEQARLAHLENVLVEVRHAVVADLDVRKHVQGPRIAGAEDQMVDVVEDGAVFENNAAQTVGGDELFDGRAPHDVRVLKGVVEEIGVISAAYDCG